MDYVAAHARAFAKVQPPAGFPVTFAKVIQGVYDPLTDTSTPPIDESVSGYAVEIPADPEQYSLLGLLPTQAITLQWVPTVMGDTPKIGATFTYLGVLRTVKHHFPVRPAGVLITDQVILV